MDPKSNGRGTVCDVYEPAYIRRTSDGRRETVYLTESRLPVYLEYVRRKAQKARDAYSSDVIDDQGLRTTLFNIYSAARSRILEIGNRRGNQALIRARLDELHEIIPETIPAGA